MVIRRCSIQIAVAGAFLASSLSAPALGQGSAPIAISADRDLAFGSIAPGPAGGSVTIDPAGGRTAAGVVVLGSRFGAASYTIRVSEKGNPHYTITLPGSVTLDGPGSATMTVDTFVSDPSGSGMAKPPARVEQLAVGATLRVGPNQPSGSYSAPFLVTVNLGN
jgi:hypothetical protein